MVATWLSCNHGSAIIAKIVPLWGKALYRTGTVPKL
jgi:hypothetical protein